jgi:hypothetical protein
MAHVRTDTTGYWVFGAIAVLVLLHGIVLLYAYRRGQVPEGDSRADARTDATSVECLSCGALNERDYRFCRRCVCELPGPASFTTGSSALASRRTL